MAGLILPDIVNRLSDSNGDVISNGSATFYLSGTTTLATIYANQSLATALPNPIYTNSGGLYINSSGSPTSIYLNEQVKYRCIVKDGDGATVRDIDPIALAPREVVSLKQFGSKNDGSTDDTAAFVAAIAYCNSLPTGAEIVIPNGITMITDAIDTADHQNIYFRGMGINTSIVRVASGMTQAFVFGSAGSAYTGLSNLKIDCAASSVCTGVTINGVNTFAMDNVEVRGAYDAVKINSGFGMNFSRLRLVNSIHAGFWQASGNDVFVNKMICQNLSTQPTAGGIVITGSEASWFSDVDTISCNNGLYISPEGTLDYISWLFFNNCAFDLGNASGITLAPASGKLIKGVTFTGCWTGSNADDGVTIGSAGTSDGIAFIGHRSFSNKKNGYNISTSTAKNITFDACRASGNSAPVAGVGSNVYDGFKFGADVSEFHVRGCTSGPESALANTQRYGVAIASGTVPVRFSVTNCNLLGNLTASMADSSFTGSSRQVYGNFGAVTRNFGSATVALGTSSIVVTHALMSAPLVSDIQLTPTSNLTAAGVSSYYVSAVTPTTFTITLNTNCTADVSFGWRANIKGA